MLCQRSSEAPIRHRVSGVYRVLCLLVLLCLFGGRVWADPPAPEASPTPQTPAPRYRIFPLSSRRAVSLNNKSEILFTTGEIFKWDGKGVTYLGQAACFPLDPVLELWSGDPTLGVNIVRQDDSGVLLVRGIGHLACKTKFAMGMNDTGEVLWSDTYVGGDFENFDARNFGDGVYLCTNGGSVPVLPRNPDIHYGMRGSHPRGAVNNRGQVLFTYSLTEGTVNQSISGSVVNIGGRTVSQFSGQSISNSTTFWNTVIWNRTKNEIVEPKGGLDPMALNDTGSIVGFGSKPYVRIDQFPLFQDSKGNRYALPVPPRTNTCRALGLNNQDDVVGDWNSLRGASAAILWEKEKKPKVKATGEQKAADVPEIPTWKLIDLSTLIPPDSGWQLTSACCINNRGEIVGHGLYQGMEQSFLLVPVKPLKPERSGDSVETGTEPNSAKDGADEATERD